MKKKDLKIMLIGILIGLIIAFGLLEISDFIFTPDLAKEENLLPDDFSNEMNAEFDQNSDSTNSSIQQSDIQSP